MPEPSASAKTALDLAAMIIKCPLDKLGGANITLVDQGTSVQKEDLKLALDLWSSKVFPEALKSWAFQVFTDSNLDKYGGAFSVLDSLARPLITCLSRKTARTAAR